MNDTTARPRRRAGIDIRLLIGLALVVASVLGVVALVSAVDTRTVVYAAPSTLLPGDRVVRSDLVEREVSLDGAEDRYLQASELPEEGLVIVQTVRGGELLPRASLGDPAGLGSTALVLAVASPPSSAVRPGAAVDIWATPEDTSSGGVGAPVVLVADAVVVRLVGEEGLVTSRSGNGVEVLVPRARVARVLQAQAAGDALAVVPSGLAWGE